MKLFQQRPHKYEDNLSFEIYPNPTINSFRLEFSPKDIATTSFEINIIDLNNNVLSKTNKNVVDVSFLPSGIYFVRLTVDNQTKTRRLIKI
jgi:hypothetical protein